MPKPKNLVLADNETWVESPLPQFPGGVVVSKMLDPNTFDRFFRANTDQVDKLNKDVEGAYRTYTRAFFLVNRWHLKNVTTEQLQPPGNNLPSVAIMYWVIGATNHLLQEYNSLGKLLAASANTSGGNQDKA